jgi:hypothetical protein
MTKLTMHESEDEKQDKFAPKDWKTIDLHGDLALVCKKGGGVVFRHELVRKVLYRFAKQAGMSPVCELSDYRLNAKVRIGDIVLSFWLM